MRRSVCKPSVSHLAGEIAVDPGALLGRHKRMGIHGVHSVEQLFDLELGKAHAQHMYALSGIGAHTIPVGHGAAQLLDDEPGQGVLILPGENQRLDADILLMDPIQHHGGEEVIDHRVDGHCGAEEDQAGGVEECVEGKGEFPHRKRTAPLAQA